MEPGATSVLILRFLALMCSLRVCHGKIKSFNVAKLTNGSSGFIQQTDEVALVCDTDAEVSTIEIIRIDDKTTVSMSRTWERSLKYHIKSVSCSDMGSYECVEDRTERMTADLVILNCPLQPCDGASVRRTIFVNTGENVKFSVCVLAVQKIADYALFNDELIRKKNHTTDWTWDYERVVSPVLSISRYHIHVKRDQVDAETYGLLNLTILSDLGKTYHVNFTIILEPSGPPDCSTNITVTDFGHDYVTISWVPGLDRGSRQHFTVYQSTDNLAWLSPGVDTENSTVSVRGLSSNTSYYFRVVSLNQYQKSHDASTCQETVFVTTKSFVKHDEVFHDHHNPDILILTLSVCSFLVIVLLLALLCWRRRASRRHMADTVPRKSGPAAKTTEHSPESSLGDYVSDDGLKYITLYPVHDQKKKIKNKRKNEDKIQYAALDFINKEKLSRKTATK